MDKTPHMIDMAMTPEQRKETAPVACGQENGPIYPWGLCLRFDNAVLEKLKVDISDWEVGDLFHLFSMAKVTSKSEHDTENGKNCCVELQIVAIGAESEDKENEEAQETEAEEAAEPKDGKDESEPPKKKGRPNYYFD